MNRSAVPVGVVGGGGDDAPLAGWDGAKEPAAEARGGKGAGAEDAAKVVGNRNSRVYHKGNCPRVGRTKEENRVAFASVADAEKAGYRPAGDCHKK